MKKTAIITGATAGIGKATAELLASAGYNLYITGRRFEKLATLKRDLEAKHSIQVNPLNFDIRNNDAVNDAVLEIPDETIIDVLVNNAGLAAGRDTLQNGRLDHWERMIDTNIKGLLYITRLIAPKMIKQNFGHIINVGSLAGKEVYAQGNVYCATKHAVDALSRAMRLDFNPHNIKVTNIAPGLVETEFSIVRFDGNEDAANQVYRGFEPLTAEDIAECIQFAVSRPKHVNIGDMLILPTAQANSTTVNKN